MRHAERVLAILLGVVVATPPVHAEVLCRSRSGAVKIRDACKKKETPVDLTQLLSADQVRAKFFAGTACPGNDPADVMVRVGDLCVDVYEASVWSEPGGGSRYGVVSNDYPCRDDGADCTAIYARSVGGVLPSRYVTWFQAQQACRNAGKRLLTNAEWQAAAAGTPDPGDAGDGVATCNTNTSGPKETGLATACVSTAGVRDMVGNLWEWVAEWVEPGVECTNWGSFSGDTMCLAVRQSGLDIIPSGSPRTPVRGGNWDHRLEAGPFAVDASVPLTGGFDPHGFRCAR